MKKRKIKNFFRNKFVKNILSAVAVVIFGFILLILTFLFDALFQSLIDGVIKLFTQTDINMVWYWFPSIKHAMFVIIIGLISWFVFKSKLGTFYKAIYMTVPLAVVFATIGMFLYQWPVIVYLLGGLFFFCVLYYLYKTKKSWLYYYTLVLIGILMLLIVLLGIDI